jgi:hypothetical protein
VGAAVGLAYTKRLMLIPEACFGKDGDLVTAGWLSV